jgi:alkaline phosphatase D
MRHLFFLFSSFLVCAFEAQHIYCDAINVQIQNLGAFPFGVASGDPTASSFTVVTQLNPFRVSGEAVVRCEVSTNDKFTAGNQQFTLVSSSSEGYAVKTEVQGLEENKTYYYRFIYGKDTSRLGRAKTTCQNCKALKIAVVSCNNYEWGYFNAYRRIANMDNIDLVVHLGDYIYEHARGGYGNKDLPRKHIPDHEIVSIEDYRSRYANYRLDPDLQALHAAHSFITIWDDHEIANDAYRDGAQNHQQEEGDWNERKKNAKKAYFEWLPLKENSSKSIQRKFQFGNLASLYMMDERLEARTKQGAGENDSLRTILGTEQRDWFLQEMQNDKNITWKIWANQVIFSQVKAPDAVTKVTKSKLNSDNWDGYAVEREVIMNNWLAKKIDHVIIVTGDAHVSMGMDLQHKGKKLGEEWVTPSITSANLDERVSSFKAKFVERLFRKKKLNPNLNYCDLRNHGFMLVELDAHAVKNTWYYEKTILKPSSKLKKRKVVRWTIGE